ncbi:ABC transporter ATP-binding protein [Chromatiales bacterium (ex Bugula neritina AB1)]|nr:ABC transporter ATP-binding protein [Chromatiales bacterium (ex Bugula neritina AB1)]
MATITLKNLRHSYLANPVAETDWALKNVDLTWEDGGAYALLGSSGCGKTTMLNLISGLLAPSEGSIHFNDRDVTRARAEERNIAQVFQFPVVYDTMTVRDNLAFPLKNRGVETALIKKRVAEIAEMLDLTESLDKRAAGLTADGKQKISLGRGLVRSDVNAILFDEPLTVIDPHLKWQLRSKLKELHQQFGATMIYVTHDQTEALTFADKVVVMHEGLIVQSGTPEELFENPKHTFIGHFIGSPGMNVLPGTLRLGRACFEGYPVDRHDWGSRIKAEQEFEVGVRPEFVRFANTGIPVTINKVDDIGRVRIVDTRHGTHRIRLVVPEGEPIPESKGFVQFVPGKTSVFVDSWLQEWGARS